MNLEQIAMACRFWADTALSAFRNALDPNNDSEHAQKRRDAVMPTARGAGIILGVSLLERLAMDKLSEVKGEQSEIGSMTNLDWVQRLNLNLHQGTVSELENFIRLRHCFAHEYGRATSKQINHLKEYHVKLTNGDILDEEEKVIRPYFEIDSDNHIELFSEASNRLRKTLWFTAREIENDT